MGILTDLEERLGIDLGPRLVEMRPAKIRLEPITVLLSPTEITQFHIICRRHYQTTMGGHLRDMVQQLIRDCGEEA